MRSEIDSSDFFDDDELSLGGSSGKDQFIKGNILPFKIGLNFAKEEDYPGFCLGPDFFSENQKTSSQEISEGIEGNGNDFTDDQIYQTNNMNEKLRLLVLYENAALDFRKRTFVEINADSKQTKASKNLDMQLVEHGLRRFAQLSQKVFEPIKLNRLISIPQSKRRFHVRKNDLKELAKKKTLIALIEQKEKQFSFKKGLMQGSDSIKKIFNNKFEKFEEILVEKVSLIEEDRIIDKIEKIVLEERKENGKALRQAVDEYFVEMQQIHNESMKFIEQEMNYRHLIVDSRNIQRIERRKKVRNSSEKLYNLINIEGFFKIIPDIGIETQSVDKSQIEDLNCSYLKSL